MNKIYQKLDNQQALDFNDAMTMLAVPNGSADYYRLLWLANEYARAQFGGQGAVFAQIGLDAQPCPVDCSFCSLSKRLFPPAAAMQKSEDEILRLAKELVAAGADELFLMTTALYDRGEFLRLGRLVRSILPAGMRLVANIADFDLDYARQLKAAGFTGAYHICRLGEGRDTGASVSQRLATIEAIDAAGLELYYCVEPIGPEHTNAELATEIFRTKDYPVGVMAVMRRIAIKGSPLFALGEISAGRLALICAVTLLCIRPRRAMGVHEPEELSLMAGANQIYAETGANPRDKAIRTETNRGFSVVAARRMLWEADWNVNTK